MDQGVGLGFYFKLLKSLILLLFIMSCITGVSLIMYLLVAGQTKPLQRKYLENIGSLQIISSTSVASLGETYPLCFKVEEEQHLSFKCPGNGIIKSIVAYYGQPNGACNCPYDQQLNGALKCPGSVVGTSHANILSNNRNYRGQSCSRNNQGNPEPCFQGLTRFGLDCCAATLDNTNQADLSSLMIGPNYKCNSRSAQFIAESVCLDKSSCNFPVLVYYNIMTVDLVFVCNLIVYV
jgi:hypothetical protein